MSKIGQDTRAKLEEKEAYIAMGIVKLEEGGYAVVQLKISGTEVLTRKLLKKASSFAEAMLEYQIESGKYGMNYLNKEVMK